MGEHVTKVATDPESLRRFALALIDDLDALETMLDEGRIETGVRRIGVEQEMFLVDASWRPAPVALEVLERLEYPGFTTELGAYNLELNAEPLPLGGSCLSALHQRLRDHLEDVDRAAAEVGARVVLCGILPTLRKSDLETRNMVPAPRYVALNEALGRLRGGPWRLFIRGHDQVACTHDSVMLESVCTSFQIHLQVAPEEFAPLYNLAQAVSAPVLAAAANSPLLFGRRLWHETRIPVFQQAIDTRRAGDHLREVAARVRFGEDWVHDSILELFREDVVRFRILMGEDEAERSREVLRSGGVPRLSALGLHNGTVYRWNRGCYGVTDGQPHLRIEMRSLPAGPTLVDEMANMTLAFGAVLGLHDAGVDLRSRMSFEHARSNFQSAAKGGLGARLRWLDRQWVDARELVLEELLPAARAGLRRAGVEASDADRYLGIVEDRVRTGQTGSAWLLDSFADLEGQVERQEIMTALTAAAAAGLDGDRPVHTWPPAPLPGVTTMDLEKMRVEEIMTTDIHTVGPDEPIDVVGKIMEWKSVRHIPVEGPDQEILGMLSCFDVIRELGRRDGRREAGPVGDLMTDAPPTVAPDVSVVDALRTMRAGDTDCVIVVREARLVGIVTERDFVSVLARLLG